MRGAARGLLFALICLGIWAVATPASAHANLLSSDPAAGSTVDRSPPSITLTFSEPPDPELSQIQLLDDGGVPVSTGLPNPQGKDTLVVTIDGILPRGVYTVAWRAVSVEDGHSSGDVFAFGVGVRPTAPSTSGPSTSGPTPLAVTSKSALYAGCMLLVAVAVVGGGLFGGAPRACRWVGVAAGWVAFVGAVGFLLAQQRSIGVPLGTYLGAAVARDPQVLVVITLVGAVLATTERLWSIRWLPWAAGATAALALAVRVHGGHAAAASTPLLAEALQWVHMMAGALWAGGLVLLVLLLRERDEAPTAEARRYSNMAVGAIAVVVASGFIRSVEELGGLGQTVHILSSSYGRVLAIKGSVVIAVIALGAVNRYRSIPRLADERHPLLRIAGVELAAIVGVLALTATLTSIAPPNTATSAAADAVTISGSDFATTVDVTLTVTPGQAGATNDYRATIDAYGTDDAFPADAVQLDLRPITSTDLPASTVPLTANGDAWTAEALQPSTAGTFRVTARIRSGAQVTEVPMTLVTRSTGTVTVSAVPGETVADARFSDGVRLQGSSSPTTPTQIHLTAFAPNQTEQRLTDASIVASPSSGEPERLSTERFSVGHFIANATLEPGTWTLDAVARTKHGAYQVTWQMTVP